MFTYIRLIALILWIALLTGCGGGGASAPARTTATLKLNLTGPLPAGSAIAGVGVTLTLTVDVAPQLNGLELANGVITPSGLFAGGTQTPPVYAPTSGTIQLALVNAAEGGITQEGEVATIVLKLTNGVAPVIASFGLSGVSVIDTRGNPISGMGIQLNSVTLE